MTHKQVIVMRKDLNMRKGKMVAQGCHASLGVIVNYLRHCADGKECDDLFYEDERVAPWLANSFTKITVYVNSEEELYFLKTLADSKNVLNCLITDNGKTEFNGIPTITCIAIGPDFNEKIDEITGHLPLL